MKTTVPVRKRIATRLPILGLVILLLGALSSSANYNSISPFSSDRDTITVQKELKSKKHKIKLYPNASHQVLFFSANGEQGRVYQFYLFDMEGKLVKQANIRNNQTTVLNKIEKGNYFFEVFSDDERIENGLVIVR
jgi:hypothetical protein